MPRGVLSPATLRLLKTPAFPISIVAVTPGSEFPDAEALTSPDSHQVLWVFLPEVFSQLYVSCWTAVRAMILTRMPTQHAGSMAYWTGIGRLCQGANLSGCCAEVAVRAGGAA